MSILVTGGAGFIGSGLCIKLKKLFPKEKIIAFDNLKRRGSEINLVKFTYFGINFIHGDIRNKEDFEPLIYMGISTIIEASAEPSVLAGINSDPSYLINTNLLGTINCLQFAKKAKAALLFLSTSRVYSISSLKSIPLTSGNNRFIHKYSSPYNPNGISEKGINENFSTLTSRSLYGATKLSSEMLVQEYSSLYGLNSIINRCGVIAGPGQFGKVDQGVFTLWMAKHYFKKSLSYNGFDGKGFQVRDLLHPDDLYDLIIKQLKVITNFKSDIYNVGGSYNSSVSLKELTEICENITRNRIKIFSKPETNPVDIPFYISDISKVSQTFKWMPKKNIHNIMEDIYLWIKKEENHISNFFCN